MSEAAAPVPEFPPGPRRIAIIGFGFSGLCLAIRLKQAGIDSFVILEKADRLGGTWRDNTYPGAACDVMSFQYCFSFEQKTDWSRKWSGQEEILAYMDSCAEKHGILDHVAFRTAVASARFDEGAGVWRIRTTRDDGESDEIEADVLVSGVGQLHVPVTPDFPGLAEFAGPVFHSARWDHSVDLDGKRVGVVGNGASAIQFLPEVAERAAHVSVFQRTPNWVIPRGDAPYSEAAKARFGRHPWLARLYRWLLYLRQEMLYLVMIGSPRTTRTTTQAALDSLHEHIEDPELRRALTPDYPIGAKRILIFDDYYPTLARDDVALVTSPIDHLTEKDVVTADGTHHPVDVLVMATGFDTNSFLTPMVIEGVGGRRLDQEWKDGAEAYLGLCVAGYPNFFMMYGPNTNLGHNSIIFMIECQANYILQCVQALERSGLRTLDLKPEVMRAFNESLHRDLERTAWARVDHSWYKTAAGKITNNWSRTTLRYWWDTRRPDLGAYEQRPS